MPESLFYTLALYPRWLLRPSIYSVVEKGYTVMSNQFAQPVTVSDPSLLFRIPVLYRYDMSAHELYEATRGVWRVGKKRELVRYAMAVAGGIVREVYVIDRWYQAGTNQYTTRSAHEVDRPGRWEFTGQVAPDQIRDQYLHRSVAHYFQQGQQNPCAYAGL